VVEITYDPGQISYQELLDVFWQLHDPTSLDDQGPYEQGSQYRAGIFYYDAEQATLAVASKAALEAARVYAVPIVTEIRPATTFWPAEDYHQQYIAKGGEHHCYVFTHTIRLPERSRDKSHTEEMSSCVQDEYQRRIAELQARYRLVPGTGPITFVCDGKPSNEIVATFFQTDPPTLIAERGDSVSLMNLQPSGSGAKYQGRNETFWERQGEALITWDYGAPEMRCKKIP